MSFNSQSYEEHETLVAQHEQIKPNDVKTESIYSADNDPNEEDWVNEGEFDQDHQAQQQQQQEPRAQDQDQDEENQETGGNDDPNVVPEALIKGMFVHIFNSTLYPA